MEGLEALFVYGTLKYPQAQMEAFGRVVEGISDSIRGFYLDREGMEIEGEKYPVLKPYTGHPVGGLVLILTKKELEKVDEYETDAYLREKRVLESGMMAWVYLQNQVTEDLEPTEDL